MKQFSISHTVSILPISLFFMGLGTGPLLLGPVSEVHGPLCAFHFSTGHRVSSQAGILYTVVRSLGFSSSLGQWRLPPTSVRVTPPLVPRRGAPNFRILPVNQPLCSSSASLLVSAAPHSCPLLGVPSVTSSRLPKSGSECIFTRPLGYWVANDDSVVMKLTSPFDIFVSPMVVYSMAPFLGPVIGPLAAGFINQVS